MTDHVFGRICPKGKTCETAIHYFTTRQPQLTSHPATRHFLAGVRRKAPQAFCEKKGLAGAVLFGGPAKLSEPDSFGGLKVAAWPNFRCRRGSTLEDSVS